MPADFTELQAEVDQLTTQVAATEGTEASAKALIEGFSASVEAEVTKALEADNAADENTIVAFKAALAGIRERYAASASALGAAVAAAPPPPVGGATTA